MISSQKLGVLKHCYTVYFMRILDLVFTKLICFLYLFSEYCQYYVGDQISIEKLLETIAKSKKIARDKFAVFNAKGNKIDIVDKYLKTEDLPIIFYIGPAAAKKTRKAPQTQIRNFFREVIAVTRTNIFVAKE